MARIKNVKINFSGSGYLSSSLFEINAPDSVPATGVTYAELDDTGDGYDYVIADSAESLSITASNGQCIGARVEVGPFQSYPLPAIGPIRLASVRGPGTGSGTDGDKFGYALTGYAYDSKRDNIYVTGVGANAGNVGPNYLRICNNTGIIQDDKGPWTDLTGSGKEPLKARTLYLEDYDAIVYDSEDTTPFAIISMSGEFLFESNPTSSYSVRNGVVPIANQTLARYPEVGWVEGDYFYSNNWVRDYTLPPPNTGQKIASLFRIHLPTMTLDTDFIDRYTHRDILGATLIDGELYPVSGSTSGSIEFLWFDQGDPNNESQFVKRIKCVGIAATPYLELESLSFKSPLGNPAGYSNYHVASGSNNVYIIGPDFSQVVNSAGKVITSYNLFFTNEHLSLDTGSLNYNYAQDYLAGGQGWAVKTSYNEDRLFWSINNINGWVPANFPGYTPGFDNAGCVIVLDATGSLDRRWTYARKEPFNNTVLFPVSRFIPQQDGSVVYNFYTQNFPTVSFYRGYPVMIDAYFSGSGEIVNYI